MVCINHRTKTKRQLVLTCRKRRWRNYSRFRKPQLVRYVELRDRTEQRSARTIIRHVRRWMNDIKTYDRVNDRDVITMEPFGENEPVYELRDTKRRKTYTFNPESFLRLLIASGSFTNPYTREELKDRDLRRLEASYHYHRTQTPNKQPIVFQLNNQEYMLTTPSTIVSLRDELVRQRRAERQTADLVVALVDGCERSHTCIIDIIRCVCSTEDSTIRSTAYVVIVKLHAPEVFNYLAHLNMHDRQKCHEVLHRIHADLAELVVVPENPRIMFPLLLYMRSLTILCNRHITQYTADSRYLAALQAVVDWSEQNQHLIIHPDYLLTVGPATS